MSSTENALWKPWVCFNNSLKITPLALNETLYGGQTFRWINHGIYHEGRWGETVLRLKLTANNQLFISIPESINENYALDTVYTYLACKIDFEAIVNSLPWRSDPILATAINKYKGIRLLKQPFDETLLCFICSSNKRITQIKKICEALASMFGNILPDGSHALPTWDRLASVSEKELRDTKMGYRAKYIRETAQFLKKTPNWFHETEHLDTEIARERLMELPGVGRKIADCVLLYGAGKIDAFPIDTWVRRILIQSYNLNTFTDPQLQQFSQSHFGENRGYAQQYLFAEARKGVIAS